MDLQDLRARIEQQAALMIAVATGGPRIDEVQADYLERRELVARELKRRRLDDPNPFSDLWKWYGYYSERLPRYQERRTFIGELYESLYGKLDALAEQDIGAMLEGEPDRTGWERVDDQIVQLRSRFAAAFSVEDFQSVGLLCRDIFVSLAEAIFDPSQHVPERSGAPKSVVDRLAMVARHEAPGASNRELRALLKANIDYANKIQHDRAGTRDQARAVAESTIAAVSLVRLVLVAAPETDAEAMREAWLVTIIPAVELHSIPLAAILREARPVELDRERIVVAFPGHASFHFQLAQEPKNMLLLREVLESVLGRSIEIEFKLAELDA